MRGILYIVIIALLFLAPVQRVDVAKLLPIRAVALYRVDEDLVLETDSGHKGSGEDAVRALQELKEDTPAVVYLDTAEYLLVSEQAQSYVEALRAYLKPTLKVCVCDAEDQVKEAAEYLDVHGNLPELKHWEPNGK